MTAVVLVQQQRPVTSAPGLTYDPDVPMAVQNESWTCSVYAADWCLRSLGMQSDDETLEAEMLARGTVTPQLGLMDARGYGLAAVMGLHLPVGAGAQVIESATWDWLLKVAGHGPIALGGRAWYHWCGVRDVVHDEPAATLDLANSAPGHMGILQRLDRFDFARLGPWSAVRVPV